MGVTLRLRKRANGRRYFYLDIWADGVRKYEYLDLYLDSEKGKDQNKLVKRRAEAKRNLRETEILNESLGLPSPTVIKKNFISFFAELAASKHRTWKSVLMHLQGYCSPQLQLREITPMWIEGFQKYLLDRVNANTASLYMSKITAALNIAISRDHMQSNPAERVKGISHVPAQRMFLTEDELQTLAVTPLRHTEIKRAFLFASLTGLRLSDVRALKWENIKLDSVEIRIRKTKELEYLPLSHTALNLLGPRRESSGSVFTLPMSDGSIWTHVQHWAKAAGISKHISFHTSRHTFATLGLTNGIDIYTLSKLLGHADLKHTQVYAKIVDDVKRKAVGKLPKIMIEN